MRFVFRKIKRLDLHGNVRDFEVIQTMFVDTRQNIFIFTPSPKTAWTLKALTPDV